ncbi:MAG: hypothetical protein GTO55_00640 [Armatimonadetes bacterium]|nr:hypothetical protein [Armatimonadota bacterium]NIM22795.1 hypothetical protein [Armatimonadota bacterium]NIM66662.1 hypothetical protein [Armatimonadota bacterium]NIM75214.1 hypothetical protein [Armatimonadota bacterium]NIN04855.1 hypothetical protein [Armatimonadota bacterium]
MGRKLLRAGKWTLFVLAALLALSPFILVVLAGQAEERLDEALKQIAATGDPVEMTQLAKPPIPDEQNAALVYRQAFDEMAEAELSEEERKFIRDIAFGEVRLDDPVIAAQAEGILRRNKRALELVHQAVEMPECDFQRDWSKGMFLLYPEFAKLRECSRLLSFESMMLLHAGRVDEAVGACSTNFRLCNAADEPSLIGQLVGYAIIAIASRPLSAILRDSQPSSEVCLSIAEEIRGIELIPGYIEAMKGERTLGRSAFNVVRSDPDPIRGLAELSVPLEESTPRKAGKHPAGKAPGMNSFVKWWLASDELTYLELMGRVIREASLPYREVISIEPSVDEEVGSLRNISLPPRVITAILMPVFSRAQMKRDGAIAQLRLAEVSLLLKAYKAERGIYPGSLAELEKFVGRALPEDPASGEALVYHREGEGFLLYSWGYDLEDDGGEPPAPGRYEESDIVIQCVH